jgi:alpha-L-fucosidase
MEMQLRELLTRYGDLFVIWFDGLSNQRKYDGARFHKLIREMQPATLINNRIGLTGDYVTPEQRIPKGIPVKGATVGATNPNDQGVPPLPRSPADFQPWETCMTINGTWAYNKHDTNYKSATQLIRGLIETASKGGNFLLNVGPTPEGTIQPEFQERLREIGRWMKTNGAAIYGSSYGPLQAVPFAKLTAKGATVYVHVLDWPGSTIEIKGLPAQVRRARLLEDGSALRFRQSEGVLTLNVPRQPPNAHASVVALETLRS